MRLHAYRQTSLSMRRDLKLAPRFYRPYQILTKVGKVAYMLQLPPTTAIHLVFHVSMLKKKLGMHESLRLQLPPTNIEGQFMVELGQVLDRQLIKRENKHVPQVLIQWLNLPHD